LSSDAGRPTPLVAILMALVAASACRLSYLVAAHTVGYDGVQRHHVETTATIFAVLGAALAFVTRRATGEPITPPASWARAPWLLPAFCAVALILYWPVLFIGPLSDDFVLMHRASSWDVSAVSSTLFRPIPLLLWSGVLASGAGTVGLHALNVVLHGVNAWLTLRVIEEWVPSSANAALMGGLVLLTAPLAPEAVAWASGIFDVSAATLVLTSVLVARAYRHDPPRIRTRALFIGTSVLAVLCKETAAVAPVLALLCARLDRSAPGRSTLRRDAILVMVVVAVFGTIRMAVHPEPSLFQVSKYALQRTLFAAFGSLTSPFHTDVVSLVPWLVVGSTVLVICVWTLFFVTLASRRDLATIARGLAWILIAIAPVWPILVVPGDLQASRYLYLAGVGWALMLVTAASARPARGGIARLPAIAIGLIIVIAVGATRAHLWHWQDAGIERDLALNAIVDARKQRGCPNLSVSNPPDAVRGAYVFRNGLAEALAARGVVLVESPQRPECAFSWSPERGELIQR
jgi:protein O-mannosyl-transferase